MSSRLGFSLDDGSNINFWSDEWIAGITLKSMFPRVFTLVMNKVGKVKEMNVGLTNISLGKLTLEEDFSIGNFNNRMTLCRFSKIT